MEDFSQGNELEELNKEILSTDNLLDMYDIQFDVKKRITESYKKIALAETKLEQIEQKGVLTELKGLEEVVSLRIQELREIQKRDHSEQLRINHNFRLAAKSYLDKETFTELLRLARMKTGEARDEIKKLKS
jgi:hypothetical protein